MDLITRRRFLLASGAAGVAAVVAAGAGRVTWEELAGRAAADPLEVGTRILVIVTLYGGNDGINTIVPVSDGAYYDARPDFNYTAAQVHLLDDQFGLNPAMPALAQLWHGKQLAVVRGVGYPQPDHSHFRSMDIWQTASPAEPVPTGWIGRWLDTSGDDPTRAVNIGSVLPPLAVGAKAAAAALIPGGQAPFSKPVAAAITRLGKADAGDVPTQVTVATSWCSERTVAATFGPVFDSSKTSTDTPGRSGLQQQFDMVARCIKAGVPTTVYTVSLGGFDTHADEKATQEALLGTLDTAMAGFLADMATTPNGEGVVVMAYSEFGRRVKINASKGTDHGTAGPVLLAGVPVKGGFYGEQPSLTDLDDGDLKSSVDFRSIYAELLSGVLRADPAAVLGGSFEPLGLLA